MYWKKRPRRRSSRLVEALWAAVCLVLLMGGAAAAAAGADKVSELQGHFDKETRAGGKVKTLDKLAEAQFEASRKASADGDYVTVGFVLEKYRDNVRACYDLLKKQEPDADRHPGNYRQLEMQVRKGIREVEDTMFSAPPALRPPLEIVHKDILEIDNELIRLLFPRRTHDPETAPPVSEEKQP